MSVPRVATTVLKKPIMSLSAGVLNQPIRLTRIRMETRQTPKMSRSERATVRTWSGEGDAGPSDSRPLVLASGSSSVNSASSVPSLPSMVGSPVGYPAQQLVEEPRQLGERVRTQTAVRCSRVLVRQVEFLGLVGVVRPCRPSTAGHESMLHAAELQGYGP